VPITSGSGEPGGAHENLHTLFPFFSHVATASPTLTSSREIAVRGLEWGDSPLYGVLGGREGGLRGVLTGPKRLKTLKFFFFVSTV
jgi:hypothetical protein